MENILLISTIYPLPEGNHGTSICHFFTREWQKMGYHVRVVHIQAIFPRFFYWMARMARNRIAAKTGAVIYTHRDNKTVHYAMDGVPVSRVPVFKLMPHGAYSKKSIRKTVDVIIKENADNFFTPDIIIGHFPNPQIELLSLLKKEYRGTKTCCVMHGDINIMKKVYRGRLEKLMQDIDIWGFRSKSIKESFDRNVCKVINPFICYSGIPGNYITEVNKHNLVKPLHNYLYVGEMIERKYPEKVTEALCLAYPNKDFHLTYIGAGHLIKTIKQKINIFELQNQVSILGKIPRDKIVEEYDKADCMVMISRGEAYGLVYLEAMARGCITIASKNEGFDGVIIDGENGFLCKSGDAEELAGIIQHINTLSPSERKHISENAIETAKRLTDYKAAKMYIEDVIERAKSHEH